MYRLCRCVLSKNVSSLYALSLYVSIVYLSMRPICVIFVHAWFLYKRIYCVCALPLHVSGLCRVHVINLHVVFVNVFRSCALPLHVSSLCLVFAFAQIVCLACNYGLLWHDCMTVHYTLLVVVLMHNHCDCPTPFKMSKLLLSYILSPMFIHVPGIYTCSLSKSVT